VLHWGDWKPCTEADARRVTGLRTWEVRRIAPATKTALTNDSGDAAKYVFVRLTRPEGYEDVHPELVLEDANINPAFKAEIVASATALTHAARAQSRIDQFIFKWICSEYEFNTDDFKQAKRDFLEAAYTEGRADQTEEAGGDARGVVASQPITDEVILEICKRANLDEPNARKRFGYLLADGARIGDFQDAMVRNVRAVLAHVSGVEPTPVPTEWMDEARALLSEVYGFASTSPRAQDNINAVLELFDMHAAGVLASSAKTLAPSRADAALAADQMNKEQA
jgi:hypothetical protein